MYDYITNSNLAVQEAKERISNQNKMVKHTKTEWQKEANLTVKITKYLLDNEIRPNLLGFHYLREAIKITIANNGIMPKVTKILYPKIADKFFTTASKVERAIRHAIEKGKKKKGRLVCMANGEFISTAVIEIYG